VTQALDAGTDVTITTVNSIGNSQGDIDVLAALNWVGSGDLRFESERDIDILAGVTTAVGDFTAVASRNLTLAGNLAARGSANLTLEAGRVLELNAGSTVEDGDFSATAGLILNVNQNVIANRSGDISFTATNGDLNIDSNVIVNGGNLTGYADGSLNTNVDLTSNGAGHITLTALTRDVRLGGSVTVVDTLDVRGDGNTVSWRGAKPRVRDEGSGNTIRGR
jgi:hypothetical protein